MKENREAATRYFNELAIQLRSAGFSPQCENQRGQIPVEWGGKIICQVNDAGITVYNAEDMEDPIVVATKDRVMDLASTVAEYMRLMETALPLKAGSLDGDYRILADFNSTVLAGHPTRYGVTFVTWDWDFDRKGLSHGHYFEGDYQGAKQEFTVRSGLVSEDAFLSQKQAEHFQRPQMGGMS